jgi:hypothetical protein
VLNGLLYHLGRHVFHGTVFGGEFHGLEPQHLLELLVGGLAIGGRAVQATVLNKEHVVNLGDGSFGCLLKVDPAAVIGGFHDGFVGQGEFPYLLPFVQAQLADECFLLAYRFYGVQFCLIRLYILYLVHFLGAGFGSWEIRCWMRCFHH